MRLRVLVSALLLAAGCSPKKLALNAVAGALSGSSGSYASDPDPQLVRDAVPFALKTQESVLAQLPRHRRLLIATGAGFAQYAWGWLAHDAEVLEARDFQAGLALRRRARALLLRGRDYALRALDVDHPGLAAELRTGKAERLEETGLREVEALYWAGAAWGAAISILKDDPDLISDVPVVEALLRRSLALDESYDHGAAHEAVMALEAGLAGGSLARAREHFERAVELARGQKASPLVGYAESVLVHNQDRPGFEKMLAQALAIDVDREPALRLSNLLAQERARWLLGRLDDLFVE